MKTIGLACDHAGFELKEYVRGWLEVKGWAYKDFGTNSAASVDYPDYAHPLALAVESGDRKSTRLNSSHTQKSRMPSSA